MVFSLSSRARFRNRGWSDEWSTREVGGGGGGSYGGPVLPQHHA